MAEPRDDTDDLADTISDDVNEALKEDDEEDRNELLAAVALTAFVLAYGNAGGQGSAAAAAAAFARSMTPAFGLLAPDGTDAQVERMSTIIAHAAVNGAALAVAGEQAPEGETAQVEWRTKRDERVRDLHRPLDGSVRAAGETFDVGGHPLHYPGEPVGPPEVWINCRCTLIPASSAAALAAAADAPSGAVVVARPSDPHSLAVEGGLPPEELHVTLGYFGHDLDPATREALATWVTQRSIDAQATVAGRGIIGFDDPPATVLMLEAPELAELRTSLEQVAAPDATHPHFTPHLTLGYGLDLPATMPTTVGLDRLELWDGDERVGGDMPDEVIEAVDDELMAAVNNEPWSNWSKADYNIQQWHRACLIHLHTGAPTSKSECKLPVRTPGGAVNRNGVHAAAAALAGARGGVDAPASEKAKAARALRGLYSQMNEEPPESLAADLTGGSDALVAVDTHDAPGWLTNPRETQRLRTYWTKGKGAAKIGWGTPGDFDRCRAQLAKYVKAPYLAGTCANLHYVALGIWPGPGAHRPGSASAPPQLDDADAAVACAFIAAAQLEDHDMPTPTMPPRPLEWFQDPGFDAPTPLTITSDGRVLGHLASWDTCHVGITGECVKPPRSTHNYAYFRTGEVDTAEGVKVPVGQITMDTGHAGKELSATATVRHYDDTGTGAADVAAGEDDHGIWIAGAMRLISEDQLYVLKATGSLSGDWRRIGGNLELVAALAVNVPGFPIPRPELAASAVDETMWSLTAAAIVERDPNSYDAERIAIAVVRHLDERAEAAQRIARVAALRASINKPRVEALLATVGGPT